MEGEYQRVINRMGKSALGAFRYTPGVSSRQRTASRLLVRDSGQQPPSGRGRPSRLRSGAPIGVPIAA